MNKNLTIRTVPLLNKLNFSGLVISSTIGYKVFINGKKYPRTRGGFYCSRIKTKSAIIKNAVKEYIKDSKVIWYDCPIWYEYNKKPYLNRCGLVPLFLYILRVRFNDWKFILNLYWQAPPITSPAISRGFSIGAIRLFLRVHSISIEELPLVYI
jgi:hypothetical protein